jgi:hypothetical protein
VAPNFGQILPSLIKLAHIYQKIVVESGSRNSYDKKVKMHCNELKSNLPSASAASAFSMAGLVSMLISTVLKLVH